MKFRVLRKQNNSRDCVVCGPSNPLSLGAMFYECSNEQGEAVLVTKFSTRFEHQSYPGRTHGGITGALLDEAIGRAVSMRREHAWGVTMEFTVKFRKPVPLGEELFAISKTTTMTSRVFEGEGSIMDKTGQVLATATGRYLQLEANRITLEGVTPENWFYIDEELPEWIQIG